jgi:hypothetical protein
MESHYGIQFEITPHESKDHFTATLETLYKLRTPWYLYLNSERALAH